MKTTFFYKLLFFALFFSGLYSEIIRAQENMLRMGICTRYSNAEMLQQAGYSYVEEGVGKFLIPDKSDEVFSAILDDASRYSLPVEACIAEAESAFGGTQSFPGRDACRLA